MGAERVRSVQPERGSVLDGEAARDRQRSHRVKHEPEQVVERESDCSSVRDTRGADLSVAEAVDRFDTLHGADRTQMQTRGIGRPTSGAVWKVWGQHLADLHRVLSSEMRRPLGDRIPLPGHIPIATARRPLLAVLPHHRHSTHSPTPDLSPARRIEQAISTFNHGQLTVDVQSPAGYFRGSAAPVGDVDADRRVGETTSRRDQATRDAQSARGPQLGLTAMGLCGRHSLRIARHQIGSRPARSHSPSVHLSRTLTVLESTRGATN
jgi:hypothetical protein